MKKIFFACSVVAFSGMTAVAQLQWQNVDSLFQPLPPAVHVYRTTDSLDGKPNRAFYVEADLLSRDLDFTVDTTLHRRLSPLMFYNRNENPLVVVNTTFFSFSTNQNLNVVIKDKKLVGYNVHTIAGRGRDTLTYRHPFGSAIGITKKRKADIAWLSTDSARRFPKASQVAITPFHDSIASPMQTYLLKRAGTAGIRKWKRWKMETAVGGGPVLLQKGVIKITNNEELKFAGKAINDKHPRTAMGYTSNNKLIILVVEGRNPGHAEGASLLQLAQMLKEIGCDEALNLDGGGSSCMLINGKETIRVSDAAGQRPVPAVFMIRVK